MVYLSKRLAVIVILFSVVILVIGALFIFQGVQQGNRIMQAMQVEQATYDGVDGIDGIIDTSAEAQIMANTLREHRLEIGNYTALDREDPARDTILKAMTMENSLNLAQLGFGLVAVVKGTGAFMIIVGLALGMTAVFRLRS